MAGLPLADELGIPVWPAAEPPAQPRAGHVRTRGRRQRVPSLMTMSSAAARPALSVMLVVSDADPAVTWYPPRRWCSLTAGAICNSPEVDAAALAGTTEAVDLYGAGADNDGAHPLEKP